MTDVIVVGAGPVGLFLALRLHQLGLRPTVLERRAGERRASRSIGIHPPSLERLDRLGIGDALLARGIRVRSGLAFAEHHTLLGELRFDRCRPPHRYVLSVPQSTTESVLRDALRARAPDALVTGAYVTGLEPDAEAVNVHVRTPRGRRSLRSPYVVACDGRRSTCRPALGIDFVGRTYPGSYLMSDVPDTTPFGDRAVVFLSADGLVESFPLPDRWRRWVARRSGSGSPGGAPPGTLPELAEAVRSRTGWRIAVSSSSGFSEFAAERFEAGALYRARVALAGDAAHVLSPIGGQGLNVGWLGAWELAGALVRAREEGDDRALRADARRRLQIARAAARRAELNMWLGRARAGKERRALVRALLRRPLADGMARLFTMRALGATAGLHEAVREMLREAPREEDGFARWL